MSFSIRSRRFQDPVVIRQVPVPLPLDNHSRSRSGGITPRHDRAITDLIAINPRETFPSTLDKLDDRGTESDRESETKSEKSWVTTESEKSWVTTNSNDELHGFLHLNPRGEVATNYHHDHLLHQKWPSDSRPPLRTGECEVCLREETLPHSPKIQLVEAFKEECFYCKIILEIIRLNGCSQSADCYLGWSWDPWYDFYIACEIHDSTHWSFGRCHPNFFVLNGMLSHSGLQQNID